MDDPTDPSAPSKSPARSDESPSLDGLLKLFHRTRSVDANLSAELASLGRDLLARIDPADPPDPIQRMLAAQLLATFSRSIGMSLSLGTAL